MTKHSQQNIIEDISKKLSQPGITGAEKKKYLSALRFLELGVPHIKSLLDVEGVSSFEVAEDATAKMLDDLGIDGVLFRNRSRHGLFYASRTLQAEKKPQGKSLRFALEYNAPTYNPDNPGETPRRLISPEITSIQNGRDRMLAPSKYDSLRSRIKRSRGVFGRTHADELASEYIFNYPGKKIYNLNTEVSKILFHVNQHSVSGSAIPNYHITTWWGTSNGKEIAEKILVIQTTSLAAFVRHVLETAKTDHYLFEETGSVAGLLQQIQSKWRAPYYFTDTEMKEMETALSSTPYGDKIRVNRQFGDSIFVTFDDDLLIQEAQARVWKAGQWLTP